MGIIGGLVAQMMETAMAGKESVGFQGRELGDNRGTIPYLKSLSSADIVGCTPLRPTP